MQRQNRLLDALAGDPEISEFFSDNSEVSAMLAFEKALALAEAEAGLIPTEAASAIALCIEGFTPDLAALAAGIAADGVSVPALVRQLRAAVAAPYREYVHWGATSQDVVDTGLMLRLSRIIPILAARLSGLMARLDELGTEHGQQKLMAHTRMQQALPFTVSDKISTWAEPLARVEQGLFASGERLLVLQFGGPVGTRDSFGGKGDRVARNLAERLGLGVAPAWHSQRDRIVEFGSVLASISGVLGKMGMDIALMAQSEVGEIVLAGGGGSSSMPHKSNPIRAEVLVALARFNAGLLGTLHQAMVHENERSGASWTLEWLTLPQMVETTAASLRTSGHLVSQVNFPTK